MAETESSERRTQPVRLLVVNDPGEVLSAVRQVIASSEAPTPEPGSEPTAPQRSRFEIEGAEGSKAVTRLAEAAEEGFPYALLIVRVPEDSLEVPEWIIDGLELELDFDVLLVLDGPQCESRSILRMVGREERLRAVDGAQLETDLPLLVDTVARRHRRSQELQARLAELERSRNSLEEEVLRRRRREEELRHDALHDSLTQLPNRALLLDRIEQCLRRMHRDWRYYFAVVFIDLDGFKLVNDTLGHKVGDRLLVEIANRLMDCIRSTDCASRALNNTAARLGGDEFVVLLDGIEQPDDASFIAGRLLEEISEPIMLDGNELRPSASAGIANGNRSYEEPSELLRHADLALYHAKRSGKRCFSVFDEEMRRRLQVQSRLESELRLAIESGELRLQYQPIFDLKTELIHGFEALVRWDHAQHGRMWPSEFLPLAEEKGMMAELGAWVLREACSQTAYWRRCFPSFADVSISINLARQQLESPGLFEQLESALEESGLAPDRLNIELTENLLVDAALDSGILERMLSKHISVHMDAFGDGIGSLSHLSRLPIHALKLDRSFVRGLSDDPGAVAAGQAVLTMAHARGLNVIAAGIEAPEELALLRSMGCDYGQGYLMSHPLDAGDVELMLASASEARRA